MHVSLPNVPREAWSESSGQEACLEEMSEGCWTLEGLIGSRKTISKVVGGLRWEMPRGVIQRLTCCSCSLRDLLGGGLQREYQGGRVLESYSCRAFLGE